MTVTAGNTITYNITVTNNGPLTATGVTLNDPLPAGETFVSATPSQGTCTAAVSCNIGTIANGAMATFTIQASVSPATPNGTTLSNTATVSATTTDPNPANNSSTSSANVINGADLSITKTGPASIVARQNVVYTITVTNNGPSSATSVVVTDPTPAGLTFVSNSGGCTTAFPCNLGTLTNGQVVTITSTFSAGAVGGNVSNTATVSSATTDPNPANNSATASSAPLSSTPAPPSLWLALLALMALILWNRRRLLRLE
jgi:uncharacterized repeat protein (TIGR01451 family)